MGTLDASSSCVASVRLHATTKATEVQRIMRASHPEGAPPSRVDPTSTFLPKRPAPISKSRVDGRAENGLAVIVLVDGFWASAIRGVVTM